MKRRLNWITALAGLMIVGSGCGQEQYPETPPGLSREMMENPLGAAKTVKKLSPKAEAAEAANKAAALKNDPRGK